MLKGELVSERSSWARQSERLGSLRYGRMAMRERPFRVRNHLVGRDASYEEALGERNRFGGRRFV